MYVLLMFSLDDVFYIMYIYFLEVLNTNCITFSNYLVGNYLRKYSNYHLQRTWFGLSRYMNKLSCFWNNFRGNFRLINDINNQQLRTFYFSSKVLIDTYFMVTLLDTIYCIISSTYLHIDLNLLL